MAFLLDFLDKTKPFQWLEDYRIADFIIPTLMGQGRGEGGGGARQHGFALSHLIFVCSTH
jgi:hypothetical protein